MVNLTQPSQTIKTDYQLRGEQTRSRRQAAGRYARPSKEQAAAYSKMMQRGGRQRLTIEEMGLLATHPYLTEGQRGEFASMAQSEIARIVR